MSTPIAPKRSKQKAKPAAAPAFAGDCAAPTAPLSPGYKWNRLLGTWMPDPKHPDHVQIFRDTFPEARRKGGQYAPSMRHVPPEAKGGEGRIPEYMGQEERGEVVVLEDATAAMGGGGVGLDSSSTFGRGRTPEGEEMVDLSDGTRSEDEEVVRFSRLSNSSPQQDEEAIESFERLAAERLATFTGSAPPPDEAGSVPLSRLQRAIARKRAHRPSRREEEGSVEWSIRSSPD
ncbi:Hypothetical predicted protein [Lecanosticta acicola]|uniref:Uncharacterized protein n=1 Tax=Lecanosticta acicola TaxID=111012 RepID=A0AAI9EFS6_9PEZI|nr:Hypothetical predicted protein [Lecanosticta acicola]